MIRFNLFIPILFTSLSIFSQVLDYKTLKTYTSNGSGKVYDSFGVHIGSVDEHGNITDSKRKKLAYIDAFGNIIEENTHINFGKVDKEGSVLHVVGKNVISYICHHPEKSGTHICLVKDKKGNIVYTVDKDQRQFGSAAVYFFYHKEIERIKEFEKRQQAEVLKNKMNVKSKTKTVRTKNTSKKSRSIKALPK
jgi:hypothetical protein